MAASLSNTFKLIAHPRFGKGCKAFKAKADGAAQDLHALVDEALSQGAISALEAKQAYDSIAQQPNDRAYLDEWAQLIRQCFIIQDISKDIKCTSGSPNMVKMRGLDVVLDFSHGDMLRFIDLPMPKLKKLNAAP